MSPIKKSKADEPNQAMPTKVKKEATKFVEARPTRSKS